MGYYLLCHLCLYKQDLTTSQLAVCLQDFPYYVEEGISHDNIWSTTPLSTEQLVQVDSSMSVAADNRLCNCL